MCPARLFVVLAVAFALAADESAWASTVAVQRPDPSDQMLVESFSRLCGELRMYGLQVRLVDEMEDGALSDGAARNELPSKPNQSSDLVGGVSLVRRSGQASAKIWVAANAAGKENVRITVSVDDADAPSLLAIRAADLLHASLRDVHAAPQPAPQPAPKPEGNTAVASRASQDDWPTGQASRWVAQFGAATLFELGKLGTGWGATIQLQRNVSDRLALTLALTAPVLGQAYVSPEATAHLRNELGTVAVVVRLVDTRTIDADVFQGVGAMHLSVHGEANSSWVAQDASAWAVASSTGASVGLRLAATWGVRASVAGIFLLPRPTIDAADKSYIARQPLLLTNLAVWFAL